MLSRLSRGSQVARGAMVSYRGYATTPTSKPPKQPQPQQQTTTPPPKPQQQQTTTTPPKPQQPAPQEAAGFSKTPQPTQKTAASSSQPLSKHEFYTARQTLPLRLYSRHGLLASRLYVLAEKQGKAQVDEVAKALASFNKELEAHPKLNTFLSSPTNTAEQKKVLIKQLTAPLKLSPVLTDFLGELADTRKAKLIPKIAKQFDDLINARDKIVHVKLTKATEDQPQPSESTVRDVLGYSKDTKVILNVVVDPKIVGGAILQSKDRYVDKSFRSEITNLREELSKKENKERNEKRTEFMKNLQLVEKYEQKLQATA